MSPGGQISAQGAYHRRLFSAWRDWESALDRIADVTGQTRPSMESVLGSDSASRVVGTLDSALAEYRAGRLLPRLFVARSGRAAQAAGARSGRAAAGQ